MLGTLAAAAASPALADECRIGPPAHDKGPPVWMDLDQAELDAAYDQTAYAPLSAKILKRLASNSELMRTLIGPPQRLSYGPTAVEKLDLYRSKRAGGPVFVFIHGGAWLNGEAKNYAFPAEMFVNAGAHYIVLDFIAIEKAGGDLVVMADQVRRGIAWAFQNAKSLGANPGQFYVGGHSSGGHLCGLALTTDWKEFGLPPDFIKGGLCMSGLYDMKPVRLSKRGAYIRFDDEMEQATSSLRHLDLLKTPVKITFGTDETPEFQRQNRDFFAAVKAGGKAAEIIAGANYNHFEMLESLGNPYGVNGRAALKMMNLQVPG